MVLSLAVLGSLAFVLAVLAVATWPHPMVVVLVVGLLGLVVAPVRRS